MNYRIRRPILPAMLGLLLAIPGCTGRESATGPEPTVQHGRTALAGIYGYNSGSTIVVYGSDGAYSVNIENGQLVLPNGRTVQMPVQLATSVANTFQAIVDDPASQLQTQLSGSCVTDPYSQVCNPYYRTPAPPRDPEAGDFRAKKTAASRGVLVRRMPSAPQGSQSPRQPTLTTLTRIDTRLATTNVAYYPEQNCQTIATSIYAGTNVWRNTRSRVDEALHNLYMDFILEIGNGRWEALLGGEVIPDVVLAATLAHRAGEFEMALAEELHAHLELDYLAIAYNTFGCWNPSASAWPIWAGGGSSSRYYCKEVWVEMSFDGGYSWHWFRAQECAYELAF